MSMYTGTWKTINSTAVIARTILLLVLILAGIISCSRTVEKQKAETSSKPAETPPSQGARKAERFQNEIPAFIMQKALTHLSRRTEETQKKDKVRISSAAVKKPVQEPAAEEKPVVIDREAPSLDIFSPSDFGIYQSSVEVRGRVGSPESEKNPMDSVEDVKSLSWEIQDTSLGGNVFFDKNGAFNFSVLTAGYSKTLILVIKAEDKSGNIAVRNIYLFDDAKGPSLSVTSPQDNSYYPVKITVTGRVGNPLDPLDSPDEVSTLSWDIPSTPLSGYSYFDREGLYNFSFSTSGIPDKVVLHIRAADMNGHFTDKYIHLSDDGKGPWFKITSPDELDYYSDNITVEGIISDSEDNPGTALDVKSFSYSLFNIPAAEENITAEPDGKFHFTVPASGLSGTQTLRITAEDSHGNITIQTLTLRAKKTTPAVSPQTAKLRQETASASLHRQTGQKPKPGKPSTAEHRPKGAKQQAEKTKQEPAQDLSKPFIVIDAPEKGYIYRTRIRISGKAGNPETQPDSVTNIKSINYSVSGIDRQGPVKFNRDGSFSFSFSAAGLHGTQVIVIQAASKADITAAKSVIVQEDARGPLLSVTSPADNSFYSFSLIIRGKTANSKDDPDRTDEVKSIFYKIEGNPQLSGEIGFDAEGIFNLDIPVQELSGNQKLIITAKDLNDHTSESEINLFDGTMEPEIKITRPKDNSTYGARLLIEGRITDPYRGNTYINRKTTLFLDIFSAGFAGKLSTPFRKEITSDSGGMFRIIVPAKDFSGSQVISLTAKTWNGKEANKSIKIEKGNSDIPSFSVTAGNGEAEITWDPVPLASDYTIYYTEDGSEPSEVNGSQVTSGAPPMTADSLTNGVLYKFLLKAGSSTGPLTAEDLWSGIKECIPLSPYTLLPSVTGEYEQIRISWNRIPGSSQYNIWRSTEQSSNFTEIKKNTKNTVYVDKSVKYGKTYYYRIQPVLQGSTKSAAISGKTIPFPAKKLEPKSTVSINDGRGIAIDGNYAYVADGRGGLKIIDISDPDNIVTVGSLNTLDALDIAVKNSYVYLADSSRGIKIIDVTEPASPELLGSRKTTDARKIALKGNYAFIADGTKGLKVIDITEPGNPVRSGSFNTPDALGIALYQNYVLLADGEKGLVILDVSAPVEPVLVSTFPAKNAFFITVHNNYALIAEKNRGVIIVDISTPEKPSLIGSYDTDDTAGITVNGNYAYIADGRGGLKVLDISDPAHPAQFSAIESSNARAVTVAGDYAYLLNSTDLKLVHILIQGNSFEVAALKTDGRAYGISLSDDFAYIADHQGGIKIVDISQPEKVNNDSIIYSLKTKFAESITISGGTAFIADGPGGVKIIDISPVQNNTGGTAPVLLSDFFIGGYTYRVAIDGGYAFTASGKAGINVIDVNDTSNPLPVSVFQLQDVRDIAVFNGIIYAADGIGGVKVIDASDPEKLKLTSSINIPGAVGIAVSGNYVFAAGSEGLYMIDISDPKNPARTDIYRTNYAENITVQGNYLYLSEDFKGLKVFDFSSQKGRFTLVSRCKTVFAISSAVKGNYAYVADSSGMRVVQILIPKWLIK